MNEILEVLTSFEVLVIYGLIILIGIIIAILVFLDKKEAKKNDDSFMIEDIEKEKDEITENSSIDETVVDNEIIENQEEEIKYTDSVVDQTTAQIELQKLTEALEKREEVNEVISLDEFEIEQEENAIISLEELLKKGKQLYSQNEVKQYIDEGDEPINLEQLQERYLMSLPNEKEKSANLIKENASYLEVKDNPVVDVNNAPSSKKFKTSPVISPVFGISRQQVSDKKIEIENTANYEKLDEEIKKTNEFLKQLKELQKNLD